jgi:predicted nucleotidyltransferase
MMWLRRPLDDVLSTPAKIAVLRALLRVSAPLSGREIARRSGVGYSPAYHALQALVASGVLSKQHHGRVATYAVNDDQGPLLASLRKLYAQEDQRTRSAIAELGTALANVVSIVLFGSEARGEARPGSDTDLLIIVEHTDARTEARVRKACLIIAEKHSLALSWLTMDLDEAQEREAQDEQFWRNIVSDGIWLYGDSLEALRLKWRLGRISGGKHAGSGRSPKRLTARATTARRSAPRPTQ